MLARFSQFFQGTQITLPFTLSAYMVRSFEGPDASEQLIGQLTGILAAAAPFSRFLCSLPWGLVSDVTGRKVCSLPWIYVHRLPLSKQMSLWQPRQA